MRMYYKAVIFDLDGTLLDTIEDIADSMNAALNKIGFTGHSIEKYKSFIGDGIEQLVRRSLPQILYDEDTVSSCIDAMRDEYAHRWSIKSRPFENIPELLDNLVALGIKMSILSNKLDKFTKEMVHGLLGPWHFDAVKGLTPVIPRKPDPTGAVEIARIMRVEPGRCVFVGDSDVDMLTALRSGMLPVGVLWGYQDKENLISNGAETLVSDPLDLLGLFKE